jgi:hypothetical protein
MMASKGEGATAASGLRDAESLADGSNGSGPELAVPGNRGPSVATRPDVVARTVPVEASAVAFQPALELPAIHSVQRAVVSAIARRSQDARDLAPERRKHLLEPIDHRLDRERDPFGSRRLVGEVVERLKHVGPRLQLVLAFGDCLGELGDPGRDPAVGVLRVEKRQVIRARRSGGVARGRAHGIEGINRTIVALRQGLNN